MTKLGPYELNTIITGDARELAKGIPDESIDIALLDPPYGIRWQSGWRVASERFDVIEGDDAIDTSWMVELYRVLRPTGAAFIFTRWDVMSIWMTQMLETGFDVRNCIVWNKGYHGAGDIKGAFAPQHEFILFGAKPKFRLFKRQPDIITTNRLQGNAIVHPAQKPVELMLYILKSATTHRDNVLDMFTGSGTVPIACKMLGRNYLAFEIDPAAADMARERVRNTQPPLFVDQPEQMQFDDI